MKVIVLHVVIWALYVYGIYYDGVIKRPAGSTAEKHLNETGGRFKYLTILNVLLQCGYYGLSVVNDLIGSETRVYKQQSSIQKLRDWLFTSLVFPMGLFVSFIFWILFAIDRELIFPASLDLWFPNWLNHVMHTLPAIGVVLELWMVCHIYQNGLKRFVPILAAYVLYLSWICYIAYAAGIWVYPVFEVLDIPGRAVFFAFLLLPNVFFVHLGQKLHVTVWGTGKEQRKEKGKKE